MRPGTLAEDCAELRRLAKSLVDDFRLYVVYPAIDGAKAIGETIREAVARLRTYLADGPGITPAKARFVEYGVHDVVLGSAFVLHDRLTDRAVGPFVEGDLEDVANTLEHHPTAYYAEPELLKTIEAGKTFSTRVVFPEVLL